MHTHLADGTALVFVGVVLMACEQVGLATLCGGVGAWLVAHAM
jgi:hypothetical protein